MAKKKSKKKSRKRNPAPQGKVVYKYKYRNKPKKSRRRNPRKISTELMSAKKMLPASVAVIGGLVGVKYAVTKFFPTQTGYVKAAIMAGAAVAVGMLGKMALKGKNRQLANLVVIGGLGAAGVQIFDTATAGKYSSYYTLGAAPPRYYIPATQMRALSSGGGRVVPMTRTLTRASAGNFGRAAF